ncbi:MAG: undecaprenyldiphospho-muramoylpentapeptide beta-N-acetylglucosaminyltransferase [Chloroflexota bacterium]
MAERNSLLESPWVMRVLLAGGGSGGSATPVLAVAEVLRARDPTVTFVYIGTSTGPERALVEAVGIPFLSVPAGKLRRYLSAANVTDVARTLGGVLRSIQAIRAFRPDVAFGAGGFASVPPLWASRLLNIPVHIHQQDVIPGLANRLLVPAAASVSVTFEQSRRHFPVSRTTLLGNPVRRSILAGSGERFIRSMNLDPTFPTVLVTGGGTGALRLNQIVAEAAVLLVESVQIIHLTGAGREVSAQANSSRYIQRAFFVEAMADALNAATIIVSRAGLGTLSEIGALGLPAIVIPMPRSHQLANAEAFGERGAAIVLDEDTLTSAKLAETILSLVSTSERRAELSAAARGLLPLDAAERVADLLQALMRG